MVKCGCPAYLTVRRRTACTWSARDALVLGRRALSRRSSTRGTSTSTSIMYNGRRSTGGGSGSTHSEASTSGNVCASSSGRSLGLTPRLAGIDASSRLHQRASRQLSLVATRTRRPAFTGVTFDALLVTYSTGFCGPAPGRSGRSRMRLRLRFRLHAHYPTETRRSFPVRDSEIPFAGLMMVVVEVCLAPVTSGSTYRPNH
jgi:hypothetical protein